MFHVKDGLYFEKLPDGGVRILKTVEMETGTAKGGNPHVVLDQTIDANVWASIIATMSYYGEEDYGYYRALNFHTGRPLDETTPLNQERLK